MKNRYSMSRGNLHSFSGPGLIIAIVALLLTVFPSVAAHPGEHVVIFGDSNTWIGGDACDSPKGWNKWFADIFAPSSCRSYARSGATLTHVAATRRDTGQNVGVLADNNVVANQILRLAEDLRMGKVPRPTVVIIAAGTNDLWFADRRPGAMTQKPELLDSVTSASLSKRDFGQMTSVVSALGADVGMLRDLLPQARIIVMSPIQSVKVDNGSLAGMALLMEACCARLGVDFIRQDTLLPVSADMERVAKRLTTDGTHTSEEGAELNGTILAREIDRIISRSSDRY